MDAIAEKSGVSKTTLYKHWRDKDALVLEILSPLFGLDEKYNRRSDTQPMFLSFLKRVEKRDVVVRRAPVVTEPF